VSFPSSKPRLKKGKKAFSCESAADLASSDKLSFYNQDEWLQEIDEHGRKPDTSEKQSAEMSASRSKIRLEEAEEEQGDWIVGKVASSQIFPLYCRRCPLAPDF